MHKISKVINYAKLFKNPLSNQSLHNLRQDVIKLNPCSYKIIEKRKFHDGSNNLTAKKVDSENLLRFPVQPLKNTLEKFLISVKPLLTPQEYNETIKETRDFENGIGIELQKLLEEEAECCDNWLADKWLKSAYLSYRDPVCIYSSPGMVFPTRKFQSFDDYIQYTSKMIFTALRYKELIDTDQIPLEKMGKNELDRSQYSKIFGTCRIPGIYEDSIEYNPTSKHIVVVHNNTYFKVVVYSKNNVILNPDEIFKQLCNVIENSQERKEDGVGVLTSNQRDEWGIVYQELLTTPSNRIPLKEIQKSLFVVCLDREVPMGDEIDCMKVSGEQLIHGGGTQQNTLNRWFDKTIQLIVNENGVNGFCYEHSPAEGQPIAIMTDYIINKIKDCECFGNEENDDYEKPQKLEFMLSPLICDYLTSAAEHIDKLANNLHLEILHFKGYGKNFIKQHKLSPDSFLQMAMQYAFYRLHKAPAAHYESAHLRIFKHGRTETIRSCSSESLAFAQSMVNETTNEERVKLLRAAITNHRNYTIMALNGEGIDRHLLGLKLTAIENDIPIPKFYETPGFVKSTTFRLSTSQVSSNHTAFMCYGPLAYNGYGCCYNPRNNDLIFAISSWKDNSETDSIKFKQSMSDSLGSMYELLNSTVGNEQQIKAKL